MEAFISSIGSILSIVLLIALGYILKEKQWFSDSFSGNISKLIMNVAMPVSIFVSVLKYLTLDKLISLSGGMIYTFGVCILGYIFAFAAVKIFNVRPGRRGTMINTFQTQILKKYLVVTSISSLINADGNTHSNITK